jgi:hypothetical protein
VTEIHDRPAPRRDELRLLLEDLACVSGTLSEIMTVWRRVQPGRPELRLGRLVRLQAAARRLAADIEAAAGGGPALDPALSAAGRLAAFEEDAAGIRVATTGPGCPEAGDRGLWELLAAAIRRAQARLTVLTSSAVPG